MSTSIKLSHTARYANFISYMGYCYLCKLHSSVTMAIRKPDYNRVEAKGHLPDNNMFILKHLKMVCPNSQTQKSV